MDQVLYKRVPTEGVAYQQVFFSLMCKEVSGEVLQQAIGDVMGQHWLYWLGHLVLDANCISLYVICNVLFWVNRQLHEQEVSIVFYCTALGEYILTFEEDPVLDG